jgi:hypothetical protein
MGPNVQPGGNQWWRNHQGWRTSPNGAPQSAAPPAPVSPPATPPVVTPPGPAPWTGNMRSPGDPMNPMSPLNATGNQASNPGGLLGMLFNPAEHGNLAYAGMANAGNKGLDYTSASSRGLTDQILAAPIPEGGYGIGTGLGNAPAPAFDVRAARLAAPSDASQAALVQNAIGGGDDWWNTILQATKK